ncbi:hypothetical protein EKH55_4724 [Sinorhizobium alkalisoli]|nr:hypothetical protein EKH55_4724 [Sinorhizobium alkalisoli]
MSDITGVEKQRELAILSADILLTPLAICSERASSGLIGWMPGESLRR